LRVRDRSQVGRTIACPECRQPLVLRSDAAGRITAEIAEPEIDLLRQRTRPEWSRRMRSPLAVAWASIFITAIAALWLFLREDPDRDGTRQPSPLVVDSAPSERKPPAEAPAATPNPPASPDEQPISVPVATDNEPADPPPVAATPEPPVNPADLLPLDVPMAADNLRLDVAAQLRQPILEFTQNKPVEVRRLLWQLAELSAVPIDASAVDIEPFQERLDRPVTLALKETTVGEILDALAERAELTVEISEGVIVLHPADAN